MIYNIPLWQELLLYSYVLMVVVVFTLLSKLRVFGTNLLRLKWRVLVSLFSPMILAVLLALSPLLILGVLLFFNRLRSSGKAFKITISRNLPPRE
ncbi:MAG TPA: hypothetical protein VJB87_03990 [Candidatus Nanoarchaeia archaeon]|nr:hypothetical protein [Candidatus Nanoarchaeia archaeon]